MPIKLGELLLRENMIFPKVTCAESLGVAALLELSGAVIPEIEAVQALPENGCQLVWVRS
jgi:hypothetical protein